MNYYFILGRENKISQREFLCVLADFGFDFCEAKLRDNNHFSYSILNEEVIEIKSETLGEETAKKLIDILGGTVKIFKKISSKEEKLAGLLEKEDKEGKIIFGLSNYSKEKVDCFKLALEAKKSLKRAVRIVAGKENDRLSSAQSFQYQMSYKNLEYGLFDSGIGKLIAVQNIDDWTRHDFGKPKSDAVSGMLPPKLARMMVNLAIGQSGIRNYESEIMNKNHNSGLSIHDSILPLVVDPFCGSGNILIEALFLGCDVIGSDISEKAVEDTRTNLSWLTQSVIPTEVEGSSNRFLDSARNDKENIKISKQDATKYDFSQIDRDFVVVSEPYLGKPRKAKLRIEEEKEAEKELSKLYLDFLHNLKLTGLRLKTIVLVFPLFELVNGKKLSIFERCIDFISDIGYTLVYPPLDYGRDYQVVKREIIVLKILNSKF